MQNTKDTFFLTLSSRLAALNPARTMLVRGAVRPAALVDENELPGATPPLDAFRLRWTALQMHAATPLAWLALECSISYATDGSAGSAGMDRGRALAAMDTELAEALAAPTRAVPKLDCAAAPPAPTGTNIFWAAPLFAPAVETGERLARTATVQVFAYQEAGPR